MKINPEKLKEIASKSTEAVIKLRIAIEEFQNLFWEQPLELVDDPATKRDIETRLAYMQRALQSVIASIELQDTLNDDISPTIILLARLEVIKQALDQAVIVLNHNYDALAKELEGNLSQDTCLHCECFHSGSNECCICEIQRES